MERLPDELRAVLDNGVPCVLATCSADGVPNVSLVSEAYWVDEQHVAVSFQFFNKTTRNVRENPRTCLSLNDIDRGQVWRLHLRYDHSETDGPIFDEMDMRIEAIAAASGMSGIFKLKAADVYRVVRVEKIQAA